MQDTYKSVAKEVMIDICMNSSWGLDALTDRYPEQVRWKHLSLKLDDFFTKMVILLNEGKIDDYQCKRFYINTWKHINKLEPDFFSRFEDIIQIIYINIGKLERVAGKRNFSAWESIAYIFRELSTEIAESEINLVKNRLHEANVEKVIEVVEKSSESKKMERIINNFFGYNLGFSDTQLETLHTKLIEGEFLDRNTKLEHVKNAFNGKLRWFKKTAHFFA